MLRWIIILLLVGLGNPAPWGVAAELQGRDWALKGHFHGKKTRRELSGAVCPGSDPARKWCLAVNDETKWAQFFSIQDSTIDPKKNRRIWLLPDKDGGVKFGEIDAEAAAYDDGFVYVIGSHGMSRSTCKFRPSQFFAFRFPVEIDNGKPTFSFSDNRVAPEIDRSGKIRRILQTAESIGPFAEKCLTDNGVNFEGLSVANGQMYFGLRGPSIDGHGFILEVSVNRVFGDSVEGEKVHRLNIGFERGIRDLAAVTGGLLLLTGHVNQKEVAPEIYFWNPDTERLTLLGELPVIPTKKAETLLVLDESDSPDKFEYRALILYDGLSDGNPTEISLQRPR